MAETAGTVSTAETKGNAAEPQQGQQAAQGGNDSHEANNAQEQQGITPEIAEYLQNQIKAAVAAERKEWDKGIQTQLSNAKSEGERLAKMSKEERQAEEDRIERENFAKEKAEYEHNKLVYETSKILSGLSFSPEFAEFVAKDDAETTKARIDEFTALMNKYKQDITNELMRGTAPVVPSGATLTKPIEQMTYTEQAAYMAAQGNI